MNVSFSPQFKRHFKKLDPQLKEEVLEKIELFKDQKNHTQLKIHKLKGRLNGTYSFSVNYQTRILFEYFSEDEAVLLVVGNHDVYKV